MLVTYVLRYPQNGQLYCIYYVTLYTCSAEACWVWPLVEFLNCLDNGKDESCASSNQVLSVVHACRYCNGFHTTRPTLQDERERQEDWNRAVDEYIAKGHDTRPLLEVRGLGGEGGGCGGGGEGLRGEEGFGGGGAGEGGGFNFGGGDLGRGEGFKGGGWEGGMVKRQEVGRQEAYYFLGGGRATKRDHCWGRDSVSGRRRRMCVSASREGAAAGGE